MWSEDSNAFGNDTCPHRICLCHVHLARPRQLPVAGLCANFGVLRSLPLIFGVVAWLFVDGVCRRARIGGNCSRKRRWLKPASELACGAYILWLAYKIAGARSMGPDAGNEGEKLAKPVSFIQAALLQLLNPKAWTVALLVTVTYMTEQDYLTNLIVLVAVFCGGQYPLYQRLGHIRGSLAQAAESRLPADMVQPDHGLAPGCQHGAHADPFVRQRKSLIRPETSRQIRLSDCAIVG